MKSVRYLDTIQLSNALYKITSRNLGTPELLEAVIERVLIESSNTSTMDVYVICQNLVGLNLAGVSPNNAEYRIFARALTPE